MNIEIRKYRLSDVQQVTKIALGLPEWFTKNGMEAMTLDLKFQSGFVAEEEGDILGFVTWFVNQGKAEIGWLGVTKNHHKKGVGKLLLSVLTKELSAAGLKELYVHTLGDSVDYAPYAKTRAFYRGVGFKDYKSVLHPDNPEYGEELTMQLKLN